MTSFFLSLQSNDIDGARRLRHGWRMPVMILASLIFGSLQGFCWRVWIGSSPLIPAWRWCYRALLPSGLTVSRVWVRIPHDLQVDKCTMSQKTQQNGLSNCVRT
ncbi:hypothetical protein I7I50_05533 [Histoplasma capsulatum G186AR]|uniref:Uncharacterized protein n=1 Tax=Ajellomyces capsulatus TaxID=5037 RepID=A0A8H8DA42_AJECA|nr:hypothetical protein I7I52_03794 [Histoplasma capsulatum]QSS76168.1 hypothetical protein I7I50_05533 [Histoplasma capsulatum G186AR]